MFKTAIVTLQCMILFIACAKKNPTNQVAKSKEEFKNEFFTKTFNGELLLDIVDKEVMITKDVYKLNESVLKYQNLCTFDLKDYDFSKYRVASYKISPARIFFVVNRNNGDDFLNIFEYNGKYIITHSHIVKQGNHNKLLFMNSMNELIYSILFNNKGQFGKIELGKINFSIKALGVESSNVTYKASDSTCMQKNPGSFGGCMTCAITECANDFPCNATCALWPASCLVGFSLACGGVATN